MVNTRSQSKKSKLEIIPKPRTFSGWKAMYYGADKKGNIDVYYGPHETYTISGEKLIGKRFKYNGKPIICKTGYHYIPKDKSPIKLIKYYPNNIHQGKIVITEVLNHGEENYNMDDDKITSNDLE